MASRWDEMLVALKVLMKVSVTVGRLAMRKGRRMVVRSAQRWGHPKAGKMEGRKDYWKDIARD